MFSCKLYCCLQTSDYFYQLIGSVPWTNRQERLYMTAEAWTHSSHFFPAKITRSCWRLWPALSGNVQSVNTTLEGKCTLQWFRLWYAWSKEATDGGRQESIFLSSESNRNQEPCRKDVLVVSDLRPYLQYLCVKHLFNFPEIVVCILLIFCQTNGSQGFGDPYQASTGRRRWRRTSRASKYWKVLRMNAIWTIVLDCLL